MIGMELLGIGEAGFGPVQIIWALVGFLIALTGSFLASGAGQKLMEKWRDLPGQQDEPAPPLRLFPIILWFGLLTGFAESSILVYAKLIRHLDIKMGPQFVWMAPVADVLLFATAGIVVALVTWRRPRLVSLRVTAFIFAFFAYIVLLLNFPKVHHYASVLLAGGLAFQTSRLIAAQPRLFYRLVRLTTVWMIAVVLALALGVYGWQWQIESRALAKLPPASSDAPNVLLIVMDTVRAESMSLYGYSKPTTPNLGRLGRKGVVFDGALATSSWTLPSHASMFTGLFHHDLSVDWIKPVRLTYPTLAEILGERGYRTGAFVANLNYCVSEKGLDRGFIHYEDYPVTLGQVVLTSAMGRAITNNSAFRRIVNYHDMVNDKDATQVNADFLDWASQDNSKPFFAFLNYYDAHESYLPPAGFDVMFGPNQPRGRFRYQTNDIDRPEKWAMSPEEIEVERSAYDGSIAYLDHQISSLIDELEKRGVLQNTLVIITSDHGEQFGERSNLFGHGNSLYYSSLHVPLLCFFPSKVPSGLRVPDAVSLRELASTVADVVGLGREGLFPGDSLTRYWDGKQEDRKGMETPVLSEVGRGFGQKWYPAVKGDLKSLVLGRYHFIQNADGREELYDIKTDPFEKQDLAASERDEPALARLREHLKTSRVPGR